MTQEKDGSEVFGGCGQREDEESLESYFFSVAEGDPSGIVQSKHLYT
jgi:hypothetical protein